MTKQANRKQKHWKVIDINIQQIGKMGWSL